MSLEPCSKCIHLQVVDPIPVIHLVTEQQDVIGIQNDKSAKTSIKQFTDIIDIVKVLDAHQYFRCLI